MKEKIKVSNMTSNAGNDIANQFIIRTNKGRYFQSYNEYYWDYSRTTGKYRNNFLNEYTDETRSKIKSGEYKLKNLN